MHSSMMIKPIQSESLSQPLSASGSYENSMEYDWTKKEQASI